MDLFNETLFTSKGDFDVSPSSCISIQLLKNPVSSAFTDRITVLPNHRLYREDHVFLSPTRLSTIEISLKDMNLIRVIEDDYAREKMTLSYFYGSTIRATSQHCKGYCRVHRKLTITFNRTRNGHYQVLFPRAFRPLYIQIKARAYPAGKETFKHLFSSFNVYNAFMKNPTFSWLNSKIYHINCSSEHNVIASWSRLEVDLIYDICKPGIFGYTLRYWRNFTLRLPSSEYSLDETSLKLLELSFGNESKTLLLERYGRLEFRTNPLKKMCYEMKKNEHDTILSIFLKVIKTCVEIITTVEFNTKILNKNKKFRIGLQIFQNSHGLFIPDRNMLALNSNYFNLEYKWLVSKQSKLYKTDFDNRIKLLSFTSPYSWMMAIEKCNEYGMSLPHFSESETIKEFIMYILHKYSLPTYLLFIGLTKKVCYCFEFITFTALYHTG